MKKVFNRFAFACAFLMIYVNACADADDYYLEFYQECFPDSVKIIKDSANTYFDGFFVSKTVSTYEYNADGLITVFVDNYSKNEYAYDTNGNLILEAYYRWSNETNSWVGGRKAEYTYDANGNSIFISFYNWDTETNTWMILSYSDTTEYTYDAIGNKTLEVRYNRDKHEYTYDTNGNLTISVDYIWDYPPYSDDYNTIPPQSWIKKNETEYTYDTNGNLTLEMGSGSKTEYTYDANGKVASIVSYVWDSYKDLWRISIHAERTANGDTALLYITSKDDKGNDCEKYKYECTTKGNLTIFSSYYASDSQTSNWILYSKNYVTILSKEENNQKEDGGNENQGGEENNNGNKNNENQENETNNGDGINNQNSGNQNNNGHRPNVPVTDPVSAVINQIYSVINLIHDLTTDVDENAAAKINIYTINGNTIVVENADAEIFVYDAMGRLVCRNDENLYRTELQINGSGIYIVRVGNVAKRVMVN